MKRTTMGIGLGATAIAVAALLGPGAPAAARMMIEQDFAMQVEFAMLDTSIGGRQAPAARPPAYLAGSPIAALPGRESLVIDADSGLLMRVDAAGKKVAQLRIGATASQLVYDPTRHRAYVADRAGDRIAVVEVGDGDGGDLTLAESYSTAAEPYGLALSPDGAALLVTTVADRTLQAFDTATGGELWRHRLDVEPRSVAIAPDESSALITYLNTGTVERVALRRKHGVLAAPAVGRHVALNQGARSVSTRFASSAPTRSMQARAAFAARFIGNGLAIVAHQMSTPQQEVGFRENVGSYGGGFDPPVTHRVAFLGDDRRFAAAEIGVHQPDAVGYRAADDIAFIAGLGSDEVLVVADASQASVHLRQMVNVRGTQPCGPTGVAPAEGGDEVLVWCSLSRQVARITLAETADEATTIGGQRDAGGVVYGEVVAPSRYRALEHRGLELFFAGDPSMSARGALACGSCHPEGRADGLSWLIEKHTLQTPVLAGRIAGTHPFKWDGGDATLTASLVTTMRRLGGAGLVENDTRALAAFVEAMPAPRAPTNNGKAVARGAALFTSGELGCASCHSGKSFTDRGLHDVETDLAEVDTPSLRGLAVSAPYYHDGSAASLEALLLENGSVHAMGNTSGLDDQEMDDLIAYLESL